VKFLFYVAARNRAIVAHPDCDAPSFSVGKGNEGFCDFLLAVNAQLKF